MDYQEICIRLRTQICYCWDKFGIKPNRIILGKNILDFMLSRRSEIYQMDYASGEAEAFGIKVVVNYDNPGEISVGYVEEINF